MALFAFIGTLERAGYRETVCEVRNLLCLHRVGSGTVLMSGCSQFCCIASVAFIAIVLYVSTANVPPADGNHLLFGAEAEAEAVMDLDDTDDDDDDD
eukprot:scaffold496_cov114-Skeletonema_marinoi.AAC.1